MRVRRWLAVTLLLVPIGCSARTEEKIGMTDQNPAGEASAIARRIGLRLPPTARIDHAEHMSGQDDAARLVMVMSAADWRSLEAQLTPDGAEPLFFAEDANFHLGPDAEGWQPSAAAGLKTTQLPWAKGAEALNVGMAPAGTGEVRLFVFWHQL